MVALDYDLQRVDLPRVVHAQFGEATASPLRNMLVVAMSKLSHERVGHLDARAPLTKSGRDLLVNVLREVAAACAVKQRDAIGIEGRLALASSFWW